MVIYFICLGNGMCIAYHCKYTFMEERWDEDYVFGLDKSLPNGEVEAVLR